MIYGIEAAAAAGNRSTGGGSPPAGNAAVHFSGTTGSNGKCAIRRSALSCTDNGLFAWAGWFKTDWYPTTGTEFPNLWMCDYAGNSVPTFLRNGSTQWELDGGDGTNSISCNIGASDSLTYLPTSDTQWRHIIAACDVNHSTLGAKFMKIYVDDVDATANVSGSSAAWTFVMNGVDFWLGDNGYGASWIGDVYDFSFWPGISLLTAGDISLTTRRLFIDGSGNPVAPSVSIAALGTPALMLTGGPAGFLANSLGGSGSLSVPAGYDAPTEAATSP